MIASRNPIVRNALRAVANAPWSGHIYKCPYCGSTNGWSYDGKCDKCHRTLPADEMAKRANEIVKRGLAANNPQDIKHIAHISGVSVDILRGKLGRGKGMLGGSGALKIKQKHGKDAGRIGDTLARGKVGKTTVGMEVGAPIDPNWLSVTHGSNVAYLKLTKKGKAALTTHYKYGDKARKNLDIDKRRKN